MADHIGQLLGKYRLTHMLGQGGFAEVYLGEHLHLGTQAAIKVLHTQLALPSDIEKFRVEARTVATLVHPHIVRVLDFDVQEGTPYLVMDYAPNGSLRQRIPAGKPLSPAEVLPALMQVADALHYAHEQKLVHRDIKPENMLLGRNNEALLSDFGIAVVAQSTSMQKTQGVAGTAAYMAPEQLQGKPRPASDLYSLGVVVYEWLAGERPFVGSFTEVASQHLFAAPPPLREKVPTISPAVEQVVLTALAKDPKERFGSARAFANAFAQASEVNPSLVSFATRAAVLPTFSTQAPAEPTGLAALAPAGQPTPHITPALAGQSTPEQQASQAGPSVLFAPTQITPPTAFTALPPAGSGPSAGAAPHTAATALPLANIGAGVPVGSIPPSVQANSFTFLPPGWGSAPAGPASASSGAGEYTQADSFSRAPAGLTPLPPPGAPGGAEKPPSGRRKGAFWRWGLAAAAALLLLAILGGGAYAAFGGAHALFGGPVHTNASTATVTITPDSSDLTNTSTITAVLGTPDASQQQVGGRNVSVTTPAHSQTVNATGSLTMSATQATGTLSVYNPSTYTLPFNAGVVFKGRTTGVQVISDASASVAPNSTVYIPAHALNAGSSGNIPAGDISADWCGNAPAPGGFAPSVPLAPGSGGCGFSNSVTNPQAFSGGQDASTLPIILQSDINGAANNLIQANQPNAQQVVQASLQSNEQLIGNQQCTPNVSSNHNAGDSFAQVTVTVTFTCTGEAYDAAGALALAKMLLMTQAQSKLGDTYALVGQIKTTQMSASADNQGVVTIMDNAEGIWVYQFSDAAKHDLARLLVGISKSAAMQTLLSQPGVAKVSFALTGGNGQQLPADAAHISIVIQPVAGL